MTEGHNSNKADAGLHLWCHMCTGKHKCSVQKKVKLCCACTCVSEFIIPRYISETWGLLHCGEETT